MPDPKFNPYDPEVLKTLPTIHGGIGDRPDIDDDDGLGDAPGAARVQAVRGDMFEFGPAHSEAMVVWMRSGFNGLHASWWHDFVPRWRQRRLLRRTTRGWEPFQMDGVHDRSWWTQPEPALLHIHKPVNRLSYLYVHPNPNDTWAPADDVVRMTRQALDTVAQLPVTSVSFNGIQGAKPNGGHSQSADAIHARLMVDAIRNWLEEHARHCSLRRVYLVDRGDGFRSEADR